MSLTPIPAPFLNSDVYSEELYYRTAGGLTVCQAVRSLGLYDYFVMPRTWTSVVEDRILKDRTRFTDRNRCGQYKITPIRYGSERLIKVCRVPNIDLHMRCACGDVHAAIPAYENDVKTKWYYKHVK